MNLKDLKVGDVMSQDVITASEDWTMTYCAQIMDEHGFHHLPVVKSERVVGLVSRKEIDLLKNWSTGIGMKSMEIQSLKLMNSLLASDCMTTNLDTVSPAHTLEECAKLFFSNSYHAIPVIENDKLVGIITTYDLLRKAYK